MQAEETFGTYKTIIKDVNNSEFFNEFELKIYEKNSEIKFKLVMTTNGEFGTIGQDWLGKGVFRNDHLALIIEKEVDWTFLKDDNEKVSYEKEKYEPLPIEIYTEQGIVIIYHKSIDSFIELQRENIE